MRSVILFAASIVYGDFCHSDRGIDVRVALKGDRLQIDASSPEAWIGAGVPKSAGYDEMGKGDFVFGSGNQLYQYKLDMDANLKPNVELKSVVENTGKVSAVNGHTNISFTRMLRGPGLNTIDPSKPFYLLFASGKLKQGETGYAALDYHGRSRIHPIVDLKTDNCGAVRRDASSCAAVLCAANTRCVDGKCVPLSDASSCAAVLCPVNTRCENGKCVPLNVASSCAAVLCAANTRCVDGKCVPLARGKKGKKGKIGKSVQRDATSCAAVLCAMNTRCVDGKCIPLDRTGR